MAPRRQQTVVMYPSFGVGHIIPMTELARVLLRRGLDVTMVLIERPFWSSDSGAATTRRVMAANPAITFHVLPPDPSPPDFAGSTKLPFFHTLQLLRRYNGELGRFLRSFPRRRLHSVVTGMFSTYAAEVAAELGVPAYTFFASGAGFLAVVAQLPALLAGRQEGLNVLGDAPLEFLGVPPIPASHMVKELLEHPEEDMCNAMVDVLKRIADTDGVLVNTFESLESRAVQALRDPRCVPGKAMPPIYCIGPVVGDGSAHREMPPERRHEHECLLAWLDAQPERSVVYLCFGSRGTLPAEQLREIAIGLERSGHRFLWVVRTPAGTDGPKKFLEQRPEPDLAALLPAGFLERTGGRGLVVTSWAPQVAVLRHRSTGAFVTHCGWNSVLEAVAAGVPMLCWPLYSEQMLNKVLMTDLDMGVAWEMEGYAAGRVGADEVEAKVRLVMDSEEGRELRARVAARGEEAVAALEDGGTSQVALARFLAVAEKLQGQLGD
ncbi:anthocyanidin 3-O-glucosyltransferase 2-like [Panicum miliaceum]|uniref:Glycosyltransferase n=1 Tax=Panicum miliaceum TaxID=4540 RepID=A0A3L6QNL6_PANMI|nr:anthocyanidin 3-O-glucosyltransferase 2-like [Panicum miliaceum]